LLLLLAALLHQDIELSGLVALLLPVLGLGWRDINIKIDSFFTKLLLEPFVKLQIVASHGLVLDLALGLDCMANYVVHVV
jgi:hypothetical protein